MILKGKLDMLGKTLELSKNTPIKSSKKDKGSKI